MGPWPFDRLLSAVVPLCSEHDVFVQAGTSAVVLPCAQAAHLGPAEVRRRLEDADVVVTHGGNTVRQVQRLGKVPIAVAREAARGEMRNDHQVAYLQAEQRNGRVRVLAGDDLGPALRRAVADHAQVEPRLLAAAPPLPSAADPELLRQLLEQAAVRPDRGPFGRHPLARYGWAWSKLSGRTGRHLDLGVGDGTFTSALHRHTALDVAAGDPHPEYLQRLRATEPDLPLVRLGQRLPFGTGSFDSASALDVLEHVSDDRRTLEELHRVLRPGGLLVVSVPARHVLSVLDPDDAKLKAPALHRAVYRRRFGEDEYRRRFVDAEQRAAG
jgi:SAM-dependent methyltransferase